MISKFRIVCLLSLIFLSNEVLFSARAFSQTRESSVEKSQIQLLAEYSMPDKINKVLFLTAPSGETKVSAILTKGGLFSVDEYNQTSVVVSSNWRIGSSISSGFEDVSPDQQWAVETVLDQIEIVNLRSGIRTKTKFFGAPIVSATSILSTSAESGISYFFDFNGSLLNQRRNAQSLYQSMAHKRGFIGRSGGGTLLFYDMEGNLLSESIICPENFDVSFNEGVTAVLSKTGTAFEAKIALEVYTFEGKLLFRQPLPFIGLRCGVGISPNGSHVAVSNKETGLLMLFDIENRKELWSSNFCIESYFTFWPVSIAVSSSAEYLIIHGKIPNDDQTQPQFLVIDKNGRVIGSIDPRTDISCIEDHMVKFIPDTRSIIHQFENQLQIYEVRKNTGGR